MNSISATALAFVQQHVFPAISSNRKGILVCAIFVIHTVGRVYSNKDLSLHSFSVVIAKLRDPIIIVGLAATTKAAAAFGYATISFIGLTLTLVMVLKVIATLFHYRSPPMARSGEKPVNPSLAMTPKATIPLIAQPGNWETLPADVAHIIMSFADLPSIANMQQTSRKMSSLFQFHKFINSALFKGSCIESQIAVVKMGDQIEAFKNKDGRTTESLIRLGFKAAEVSAKGNLSNEKLKQGLKQMASIVNQLFDQRFHQLRKWEEREDADHLSPARQLARYHLDLTLWAHAESICRNNYSIIFSGPSADEDQNSFSTFNDTLKKLVEKVTHVIKLAPIQWASSITIHSVLSHDRQARWNAQDAHFKQVFSDRRITKANVNKDWVKKIRAYLAPHSTGQFHAQKYFSSAFTFKPKSHLVICGLAGGQLLQNLAFMKSEVYWKMIGVYEQILLEGHEDWSPLCQQLQELAKAELDKEDDTEDYATGLDPRLRLRLLTRGNHIGAGD